MATPAVSYRSELCPRPRRGYAILRNANLRYADEHYAKAGNLVDPRGFEPLAS
jgi:hypothetical protein